MTTSLLLTRHALVLACLLALGTEPLCAQPQGRPAGSQRAPGAAPEAPDAPDLVKRYGQTITPEELAAQLYYFASDDFAGRETATPGQKRAARYLAAQYRGMGLAPRGTARPADARAPEAFFQPFPVHGSRFVEARLQVTAGTAATGSLFSLSGWDGRSYLSAGTAPLSRGGVVFAGYGISDGELGYDDYAALRRQGVDVSGKWVLVLRDEPLATDSTSLLPTADGKPSDWTLSPLEKSRAAFRAGEPVGLLIVGDAGPRGRSVAEDAARIALLSRDDVGGLALTEVGLPGPYPPTYVISTELADEILRPSGQTVRALQEAIDSRRTPKVFEVPGVTVASHIRHETFRATTENVLAFLEGSDPDLRDEVVVISSHYDHVGVEPRGEGDVVYNGADDDGSGTVAILEIAEAFAKAREDGAGPRRSLLFLNVSGEEKGLLGSSYYADVEPVFPLEQTVANLNIDMIGRYDPTHPTGSRDYVYIIGSNLISQELHDLNARMNELAGTGLELDERFNTRDDPNQFYRRSDHWNFGKHGIPFIFFFTGTHEDYHGLDDEPEKIDYDRLARIARLIFTTAWQVANQDTRPAVSGAGFN